MRHSKYASKKIVTQEGEFDSKLEYQRWLYLKELQKEGKITKLARQVKFTLIPTFIDTIEYSGKSGKTLHKDIVREKEMAYYADFVYMIPSGEDGVSFINVEDAKGMKTPEYVIKRKLMRWLIFPIDEVFSATKMISTEGLEKVSSELEIEQIVEIAKEFVEQKFKE